jgi:hypothetical protein
MPDYSKSKIYKIVNYDNDDIYIGSTTEPTLARRLAGHVGNYRNYLNGKGRFITSIKIIETGNYDIQLIEAYPCNNKMELHAREGYWIKQMDCVNKRVEGRTIQEYYKAYYEVNKEIILKQQKEYREANKDIISAKRNKKEPCICGAKYTFLNKAHHLKSKRHQSYINSIDYLQDIHKYVLSIINKYK